MHHGQTESAHGGDLPTAMSRWTSGPERNDVSSVDVSSGFDFHWLGAQDSILGNASSAPRWNSEGHLTTDFVFGLFSSFLITLFTVPLFLGRSFSLSTTTNPILRDHRFVFFRAYPIVGGVAPGSSCLSLFSPR